MNSTIKDAKKNHWVYRAPDGLRPYLQLARYDRPVGYWLLALPGWIGLAFASLSHGFAQSDLKWAVLILIGAIAMRGAGCTYNDIVDRDLDALVDRTALRPIPAGTISVRQAWIWLGLQCAIGLIVLLFLPRLAQIISLCSIPLVAAYPFMKRITWWPQVWLGMTFNWAVLVAYAAKTETLSPAVIVLYVGLIFWTVGYDTIYACQDIEDDMKIGVKSTARRFGKRVTLGVGISYLLCLTGLIFAKAMEGNYQHNMCGIFIVDQISWSRLSLNSILNIWPNYFYFTIILVAPFAYHLIFRQVLRINIDNKDLNLKLFKSNTVAACLLMLGILWSSSFNVHWFDSDSIPCMENTPPEIKNRYQPLTPS